MSIERNNYRILLCGPKSLITKISYLRDFERLFPSFNRTVIFDASHARWHVVIRFLSGDRRRSGEIENTDLGWDVYLDTNDVNEILYGFLVPAVSACITAKQWIFVDAAAAYLNNSATLLFGRGKSTTSWNLARRGVSLIAEDTVLLVPGENGVVAYGSPSILRVDYRMVQRLADGVDGRGRIEVRNDGRWVPSGIVRRVMYLDPTHGPSSVAGACDSDRKSWIASLCCDRTAGRGKYFSNRHRTAIWSWPRIVEDGIERVADALIKQTSTFRLSGDLTGFASLIVRED